MHCTLTVGFGREQWDVSLKAITGYHRERQVFNSNCQVKNYFYSLKQEEEENGLFKTHLRIITKFKPGGNQIGG